MSPSLLVRRLMTVGVSLVSVAVPGAPASADTFLKDSSPRDGAVVSGPLERVRLDFAGEVSELGAAVVVTDAGGAAVAAGAVRVQGRALLQELSASTSTGRWRIDYRAVAADGHPVTGTVAFTVAPTGPASSSPAASAGKADSALPAPSAAPRPAAEDGPRLWTIAAGAALALAALTAALPPRRQGRTSRDR